MYLDRNEVPGPKAMIAKTERTLKRNIIDPLTEMLGADNVRFSQGTGECWILGQKTYAVGANDARAEQKIRGVTLAGILGDEVTLWPEDFFVMALGRLRIPGAKFFGTTNPDLPGHYLMRDYINREDELDLRRFHFVIDDNPTLDPEYVAAVKAEYTGLWYRRYILGEWCVAEGAVYDMFDPDVHVVRGEFSGTDLPKLTQHWVGIDYGGRNTMVYLRLSLGQDGNLYFSDEWSHSGRKTGRTMTDKHYAQAYLRWIRGTVPAPRIVASDPSEPTFIAQLVEDRVPGVRGADNRVIIGIRSLATLLGMRRLYIHERCTGLIEGLQSYAWDARAEARGEEKPVKQDDDFADAARYAIMAARPAWRSWLRDSAYLLDEAA